MPRRLKAPGLRLFGVPALRLFAPLFLFAIPWALCADPLPAHAPEVVRYRISVKLDPVSHQLTGRQQLTWNNPSGDAVPDLWVHLYLNAFKNSKTTFFRESGGQLRGDVMPEDGWGWIDVRSIRIAGGADLRQSLRFEAPDDGNRDDQTVGRVVLPQSVPPHGTITLDIEFKAQLPRVFARTGYADEYQLVGQWFPKLAVYEPAGVRGRASGGWNAHQFHANSEFYADFGRFDVDITVPATYVVGATGKRTSTRKNADGTVTYAYSQQDVHEFGWTADPDFVELHRTFSATRDVSPDEYARTAALLRRSLDEVRLKDVEIILLLQPTHRPQAERHFQAAVASLKWFGLLYGRYPYDTLTVVDPGPEAGGSAGMEYPTFITAGTATLFNRWPFNEVRAPEGVTIHEFGHQYWYGMVANNEFEEAWLDEGLNTYSTSEVTDRAYGTRGNVIRFLGLEISDKETLRMQNTAELRFDRVRQPAWTYQGGAYGFYSYTKPGLLLQTLENYLGRQTMARVMRTYHERWRFKHPASEDFYAVANEVSGQDLTWFFRQAVEGNEVLDYEVASVASDPVLAPRGYLDTPKGRRLTTEKEADKADELVKANGKARTYRTTVVVRRRGGFVFPVVVGFKFEGKPLERVPWDGKDSWKRFRLDRPERLEWAEVDPDGKVMLDANWLNNGRRVEPDQRPAAYWFSRALFWYQNLLATVGW